MSVKPPSKPARPSSSATRTTEPQGFTAEERAAMKARTQELKAEARLGRNRAEGERAVLAALALMPEPDRTLGEQFHALVGAAAPELLPRTWYGMPAYAREGQVVCFFQSASKFKTRYTTIGFSDAAHLDEGTLWPTTFALTTWTPEGEAKIDALVRRAVSEGLPSQAKRD